MSRSKLLLKAVSREKLHAVKQLIQRGANVNYRSRYTNTTPLLLAVKRRNLAIVKELLQARANVDTNNENCSSPIVLAVRNGDVEIVKNLIQAHDFYPEMLSIIANAEPGCTMALHVAVEQMHLEMVQVLLSAGASLTDQDTEGNTPLHIAVKHLNLPILKLLVKKSRSPNQLNVLNNQEETPLQLAVVSRLGSMVVNNQKKYPLAALRILILRGASVTGVQSYKFCSPLSAAMNLYSEDPKCTQALIKYGMFTYASKSSWQTINTFDEYPFNDEACQQTLIKYYMLKYADELILQTIESFRENSFYDEIVAFIRKCDAEIDNIKKYMVNEHFSLFNVIVECIVNKNDFFFSEVEDTDAAVHNVFNSLCCDRFPRYFDLIASVFTERKHLEDKLLQCYVFTVKGNLTFVILNHECVTELIKYLPFLDLLHFTVVYFECHEHGSRSFVEGISSMDICA